MERYSMVNDLLGAFYTMYVNSCRPNLAAKKKALPALRESKVHREMRAREREQSARLTYFKFVI